jgi:hypothetical protein
LENLKLVEEDHPKPRLGELLVRIRASSLNFHDDMVVLGKISCADGRIPMSDGAEEVIAVGDDVDEFKVADTVVSTFWPYYRPPFSAAGNRRCLQIFRNSKALWQGLPRTLKSPLSTPDLAANARRRCFYGQQRIARLTFRCAPRSVRTS